RIVAVSGRENEPATYVSWYGADAFCRARGKRLPAADEWELAARGEAGRPRPWGDGELTDCHAVNYMLGARGCDGGAPGVGPVGGSPGDRTPDGIFDLAGNVVEWMSDEHVPRSDRDVTYCSRVGCRAMRGGSFHREAWDRTAIIRGRDTADNV